MRGRLGLLLLLLLLWLLLWLTVMRNSIQRPQSVPKVHSSRVVVVVVGRSILLHRTRPHRRTPVTLLHGTCSTRSRGVTVPSGDQSQNREDPYRVACKRTSSKRVHTTHVDANDQ